MPTHGRRLLPGRERGRGRHAGPGLRGCRGEPRDAGRQLGHGLRDAGEVGDEGVQGAPRDVVATEEVALPRLAVLEEGDVPGPRVARVDDVAAAREGAAGGVEQVAQHDGVARPEPVERSPEHDGRQGQHDVQPGARRHVEGLALLAHLAGVVRRDGLAAEVVALGARHWQEAGPARHGRARHDGPGGSGGGRRLEDESRPGDVDVGELRGRRGGVGVDRGAVDHGVDAARAVEGASEGRRVGQLRTDPPH